MRRIVLYLIVAMIMFIVGVTANTMVNSFGWFAVEEPRPVLTELRSNFLDIGFRQPNHCSNLVLSVTSDGALYLKGSEMGTLRDTNQLKARLSEIFALRTERRVYRDTFDLRLAVPENRPIEKTVFIKAPRTMSYGEVTDLIKVVREAGADPIGLVSY
jgi:biopolymer transport protein ExbD